MVLLFLLTVSFSGCATAPEAPQVQKAQLPLNWFAPCALVAFTGTQKQDLYILIAEQDRALQECSLDKQSIKTALEGSVEFIGE
jgi:hypothetical protein